MKKSPTGSPLSRGHRECVLHPLREGGAIGESGEAVMAGLMRHLVDEPGRLERGGRLRDHAGQPVQQVAAGLQARGSEVTRP